MKSYFASLLKLAGHRRPLNLLPQTGEGIEEAYRSVQREKHQREDEGTDWQKVADKIERLHRERPNDHVSSFLADLRVLEIGRANPSRFYKTNSAVNSVRKRVLGGLNRNAPEDFYFPDVVGGNYTPNTIGIIRYLMKCVRKDTSDIVELGSGWSSNLFQIYVGLGQTRSAAIRYHGAEFTKAGQAAGRGLAAHDAKIQYHAYDFDYREPDLSFLTGAKGHCLVFTRHSIEQVDLISDRLYEQLANLKTPVTLVHAEPVGWQSDPLLLRKRLEDDKAFFDNVKRRMIKGSAPSRYQTHNAAWWSWLNGYNVNLLSIIERYRQSGLIDLVRAFPDFEGNPNIVNPSSLYHLEFKRAPVLDRWRPRENRPG